MPTAKTPGCGSNCSGPAASVDFSMRCARYWSSRSTAGLGPP